MIAYEKIVARIISFVVPFKHIRKNLRDKIANWLFTRQARRRAGYFGWGSVATGKCILSRKTEIGENTILGGVVVLGHGPVRLGNHISTGPGILIQTQSHDYNAECLPFSRTEYRTKPVIIDDCVWLGMNVTLLPGTHIGEGSIIQMGSVVHGEIPPLSIAGGNPAKVFAWRDKAHYEKLKSQNRYIRGER